MYTSVCKPAEKEGIVVLHGSRGIFHTDKFPPFRSVYKAIEEVSKLIKCVVWIENSLILDISGFFNFIVTKSL